MKTKKTRHHDLRRLMGYLAASRREMALAALSAVGSVALTLVAPRITGRGVDMLVEGGVDFAALGKTTLLLAAVYLAAAGLQWVLSFCATRLSYRTVAALRRDAFFKLHRLPIKAIDGTAHGDLTARVAGDAEAVGDGLIQGVAQLLTGGATIVGTLAFLLSLSPLLMLLVVLLTPLSVLVAKFITGRSHHLFKEQAKVQGEETGFISERMGAQRLVLAFSQQEETLARFDEMNERLRTCGYRAQLYSALINPLTRFVNHLVYIVTGAAGAYLALSGQGMTVGGISACLTYANSYTKPFNEISGVMTQLQSAAASLRRLFALMDAPEEVNDEKYPHAPRERDLPIRFEHVSFGYEPGRTLIHDLNLTALPGRKVAIVGPTGAGKTTLVNLLMRFYDLDGGRITLGNEDIAALRRSSLRKRFGMVLQESWLFEGTVRDNLRYGRPDATDAEVEAACQKARADSFIRRLPQGYDTVIGGKISLSEGQKQLLCIARVMLADPGMLILDEATSFIDTRTEQKVNAAFDAMMEGKTTFIVAHRLSTIRRADVILVLRDGDIVEMGRHEELLKKDGFYAKLYNSQFAR
ncbi:MAG: ABC transporter ATP-binding protein/permease [Clostridiales bacterium]|nr:ABC transporter ATP-binding protein/permease [Clostridiales bacterium]